jgi:hypothetical protein
VWGFDSFEGLPESVAMDLQWGGQGDPEKRIRGFSGVSYERLTAKIEQFGLQHCVRLMKGFFKTTLPACRDQRFCFVHLDCDIYESYKECLEFFYPRTQPGGIILFDEYNDTPWPGCNRAVDEFLTKKPEQLTQIESDNYQKWYIRKQ